MPSASSYGRRWRSAFLIWQAHLMRMSYGFMPVSWYGMSKPRLQTCSQQMLLDPPFGRRPEGAAALTSVATTHDSGAVSQAAMAAMQGPTAASISACSALPTAALWPLVEMIISG